MEGVVVVVIGATGGGMMMVANRFCSTDKQAKNLPATFEMKNRKNGTMIQNLMKIRDAGGVVTFQDVSLVCCLLPLL